MGQTVNHKKSLTFSRKCSSQCIDLPRVTITNSMGNEHCSKMLIRTALFTLKPF
uniref:Uncharacterized protein n=1 Tax=Anguilla anguilla TaxID=7936 RepID=A0A0E9Q189_ANGAN